jgi:hypothetical protein
MAIQKVLTRKNYGTLYKWKTTTGPQDKANVKGGAKRVGCDATAGSQGQDYNVGYVVEQQVINGQVNRLAYVECDYVK